MRPAAFRNLPRHEQIEMIAHRREYHLRKAHGEKVQQVVGKIRSDEEGNKK